jgi:hypothetical protein
MDEPNFSEGQLMNPGLTKHGHVTFSPADGHFLFLLHSKESIEARRLEPLVKSLEPSSLAGDVPKLVKIVKSFEEEAGIREKRFSVAQRRFSDLNAEITGAQAMLLWIFLRRYIAVFWWRF